MPNIDWTNKNTLQNLIDTIHARLITKVPHYAVMPEATVDLLGEICQFVGETDEDFTNAYFYKCVGVEDETTGVISYEWQAVEVQNSTHISAEEDNSIIELEDGIYSKAVQLDVLPNATEDNIGVIYQYTGETTEDYTNGYFYANFEVTDPETGTTEYIWKEIKVQDDIEHIDLTMREYELLPNEKLSDDKVYFITDADDEILPIVYGWRIDPNESDPFDRVTYLEDAVGMLPASMGSTRFDSGSWGKAFFVPRPCMLKFDGTVDYYLDPNDYSKKADGTPSDYNNLAYNGNAMLEFDLIWYKLDENEFYVSNMQADEDYQCACNIDANGNITKHFYVSIYNGVIYDGKMRSISGIQLKPFDSENIYSSSSTYEVGDEVSHDGKMWRCETAVDAPEEFDGSKWTQYAFNGDTTGEQEVNAAMANNTSAAVEWYTDVFCDRGLINALLILISKSTDSQSCFGNGVLGNAATSKERKNSHITGSLDKKGMFYGSTTSETSAVKVFGKENWWGLEWYRTAGLIGTNNGYLYKMTQPYNSTGSGYTAVSGKPNTNGYIKNMSFGEYFMLPSEVGAYSSMYYKDGFQTGNEYALFGGSTTYSDMDGAFATYLNCVFSVTGDAIATSLSCKPLAEKTN